jgi:cysteine-rich repeat protein
VRACVDESTVECRCDRDVCGNGLLEADEQCDDGGIEADDGCSPECTLEAIGDGEGSCASPFALPLDSVSEWNVCRYDDAVAVRPGSGCTLASVGPDVVFTINLERESRVLIEAFDEAEVTDVDVVVAVASSCGEVVQPQVCDDGVACDDAESSDGCVDGEQPRQARVDRVLSAGRWFVVVETRRSTRGDTEFACGAVRIEVRDDGERR